MKSWSEDPPKVVYGLSKPGQIITLVIQKSGEPSKEVSWSALSMFLYLTEQFFDISRGRPGQESLPEEALKKQKASVLKLLGVWLDLSELDTTRLH